MRRAEEAGVEEAGGAYARPIRVGILGAARVATYALIAPARDLADLQVAIIGARDPARAAAYAGAHGIPRTGDYAAVVDDPAIDAVYVALPNALHAAWSLRALAAGKAVLCEKPLALNARQAADCLAGARRLDRPFVEAMHWRHHPAAARLRRLVEGGALGRIHRIETAFHYRIPPHARGNIRLDHALGGGALLDAGGYGVNLLRLLLGEPARVLRADARTAGRQVDVAIDAELLFDGGAIGRVCVSNDGSGPLDVAARIVGEAGSAMVRNPFLPDRGCAIAFDVGGRAWVEAIDPTPSYVFQARVFAAAVRGRRFDPASVADAAANLAVVDMIYRAAGLLPRGIPIEA